MELAPGKKLIFYQRLQPEGSYRAVGGADSIWSKMLPDGVRVKHDTYTVAGVIVGETTPVRRALKNLHPPYVTMVTNVADACGKHSQACLAAVRLAYSPVTKYGHHFSSHPPCDTAEVAEDMRHTILRSAEVMLHIPAGSLTASAPDISADHRFFDAIADGGCGFSDPHVHRYTSFVASLINSLPLLLTNRHFLRPLRSTERWPDSPSRTLRYAHVLLREFAQLAALRHNTEGGQDGGVGLSHSGEFTRILIDSVDADSRLDVRTLATAAHKHGHRTLARLLSRQRAHLRETRIPLQRRVAIVRDASAARGAGALLNAYGYTADTTLTSHQTSFLYCHRLGLPLPYLKAPFRCSPRCQTYLDGALRDTMAHGYHQIQCNISYLSTMRHNAWLETVAKLLRKWCGITTILGQSLRHSEGSKKSIDAIFTDPSRPEKWPTCCDNTCINPMLPSHIKQSFSETVARTEERKNEKHAPGCRSLERHFVAAVLTTAGSMGQSAFLDWWDAVWKQAAYQHTSHDRTAYDIHAAKQHAEACLHAVIVRHSTLATEFLTTPPTAAHASRAPPITHSEHATPRAPHSARGRGRSHRGRSRSRGRT